ncbi:MAG: tetratricopeptide repeat protein [Anaerolineae bacterium]|nr:tetratricopeptide repeat protein [Anaerolineae bacterium]
MSGEQAIQYLQQGIAAAKAKKTEEARRLLQTAIRLDPENETAWLWLASVAKDNQERIFCLRQILQINPQNELAIKGLQALGIATGDQPQAAARPVTSNVPRPTPERIKAAQRALGPIIQAATEREDPYSQIQWVHKRRNRAGERAATLFTIAIRVVPVLLVVGLLAAGAYFVSTNPSAIALAPTWTPSHTPTVTPTPTPGFTPTPSPTPRLTYTPSPAIDPSLPRGDLSVGMTITPVYPRFLEGRVIQEAVMLIDAGRDSVALPTLSALRETLLETSNNPNPFYYEAIALTNLGDTERAERVLQEGIERLERLGANTGLLHAGLAYVYAARGNYRASNEEADLALTGDPALVQPYYTLVRNALATENYQEASRLLNEAQDRHPADVNLWLLRGELNLLRGQPAEAQQNARVALYIDPSAEEAYLLQARADIAFGDYGLAVLHLQDYLFLYPGSIQGWTLLGEVRTLEGNDTLAIDAYSRAVNTAQITAEQFPALMARAALYARLHQPERAYVDYTAILDVAPDDVAAREGRARAAYLAGRFGEAIEDLDILLADTPGRYDLRLLKAQALVDGANPRNEEAYRRALRDALNILAGGFPTVLAADLRPVALEYRARILLEQQQYRSALADIDAALAAQESGSRHYLRGRIQEALGNEEEAAREYDWVQRWGRIYAYPFLPDAVARLEVLAGQS